MTDSMKLANLASQVDNVVTYDPAKKSISSFAGDVINLGNIIIGKPLIPKIPSFDNTTVDVNEWEEFTITDDNYIDGTVY
jgi:hypothetical protein